MKNNMHIMAIVAILIVGAVAFFGGMQYQKSQRGNFAQFAGQNRTGVGQGNQGNRANFRPINGQIISADDKSITVKLTDGSSKIVLVSDSSTITEATSSTKQALTVSKQVLVVGTTNSDGSVTASNIQLNPQMRQFGPSGAPRQ